MTRIFIDTLYWIARINPRDQWHAKTIQTKTARDPFQGVTSEAVLIEVANYFCAFGPDIRAMVSAVIRDIVDDPAIETVPQTRQLVLSGLALYAARLDKHYSLTDCLSMVIMREHGLTEILTHDNHFTQEGFSILL